MAKKIPKQERVNQIIDTAVEVFLENGYETTSVDAIAKQMGISKGGIYHHFSSKDEILIYANDRFMEPIYAFIIEADQDIDKARAIKRFIAIYLTYWKNHPKELMFTFLTMTKMMNVPELWGEMKKHAELMLGIYESWYKTGMENGTFKNGEYSSRAKTLMAALDGITAYLVLDDLFPLESTIQSFQKIYVDEIVNDL